MSLLIFASILMTMIRKSIAATVFLPLLLRVPQVLLVAGEKDKSGKKDGKKSAMPPGCPFGSSLKARLSEVGTEETFNLGDSQGPFVPGFVILADSSTVAFEESGEYLGAGSAVCFNLQTPGLLSCTYTLTTEYGNLQMQGIYEDMTIVGGSGCFEGATGTFKGNDDDGASGIFYDIDAQFNPVY